MASLNLHVFLLVLSALVPLLLLAFPSVVIGFLTMEELVLGVRARHA